MGSNSRSASSQTTNNTSTTFGIQGANNGLVLNGNGNTVTDGGAFKVVGDLVKTLPMFFSQGAGMVSDGFNAVSDISMSVERQGENFLNASGQLVEGAFDTNIELARLSTDSLTELSELTAESNRNTLLLGAGVLDNAAASLDDAARLNADISKASMEGNFDLAQLVTGAVARSGEDNAILAGKSLDNSAYLAEMTTKTIADSSRDANKQLADGFGQVMDFANDFSRSDGAAIAESNNKMMMVAGGVVLTLAVLVVVASKRKAA
ncbi:hypothetical protein Ssed_2200 [Shewanella sediminis HAW-EB3]|uniref:Uncharacterized protein n=1 Tax=Shewanella sediminis (strain HAW-EB3) TaxID=425104 RepID=A8FVD6_SHESH|nr:hypothetical protein [Shewanella sediminis]ABV36809.1 hypothetical protein Ssed_2200 [Shewanella sediminis HAW-EB3]